MYTSTPLVRLYSVELRRNSNPDFSPRPVVCRQKQGVLLERYCHSLLFELCEHAATRTHRCASNVGKAQSLPVIELSRKKELHRCEVVTSSKTVLASVSKEHTPCLFVYRYRYRETKTYLRISQSLI
jgi:hypothetical protein